MYVYFYFSSFCLRVENLEFVLTAVEVVSGGILEYFLN